MKSFYTKVSPILGYWWHIYCISLQYMIHSLKTTDLNTQYVSYGKGRNVWQVTEHQLMCQPDMATHTFHACNKPPVCTEGIIDTTFNITVTHFSQSHHYEADSYWWPQWKLTSVHVLHETYHALGWSEIVLSFLNTYYWLH